jgi:hypothetical protein
MTVTTTSHWSREMAVSLGPQGTLVMGMKIELVTVKLTSKTRSVNLRLLYLDEMRHVYSTRVSTQLGFVTGIRQQLLPQLVIGHVKMTVSLGP